MVVGVSGLVVAAGAGLLVGTSGHLVHPLAYSLQISISIAATVGVAICWAVLRPGNRMPFVLLAYALCIAVLSLNAATSPALHSVGVISDAPAFFLGYYLVFAFPEGRVTGRLEKLVLAGIAWVIFTSFLPWFLFSPVVQAGGPLAGCTADCPSNAMMIADKPGFAAGFGNTEEYFEILLPIAIVAVLVYRFVTASGPRRRALFPVYLAAVLLSVPFCVFHLAESGLIRLGPGSSDTVGWFLTAGRIMLPFAYLVAILQAMLFAGIALKKIMSHLRREEDAGHLRTLVADALDDPPLELAFEVGRGTRLYVDSHGDPIDIRRVAAGRSATALRRDDETVAYIVHDAALEFDPELVQAAGLSVLLALDSGRLETELRSKTAELQTSRQRIATAGDRERQRIERDLHDGAQQRLMAIQIKLALARDHVDDPELASELDEIGADASLAVDDLRGLAHGIYPTVLRERGLGDGIRSLARNAPLHINVVDAGIGRSDPAVEAAVYFCVLEAMQNAMKHAGTGARLEIALDRRDGDICFGVVDDGAGFDLAERSDGIGLQSMRDRIDALGGELVFDSAPGAGTRVRGTVPG